MPDVSGIYAIYENGEIIYIGISSNLRRRLLGDHRSGDRQASSLRRNLAAFYKLDSEEKITEHILNNFKFKYAKVDSPKNLEHFVISILMPKLNR